MAILRSDLRPSETSTGNEASVECRPRADARRMIAGHRDSAFTALLVWYKNAVRSRIAAAALGAAVLTGCAPAGEADARSAAERFEAAIADGDAATACSMLSERARSQLEGSTVSSCAEAVSRLRLPGAAVASVSVWGDKAQARLANGVVFLAEFRSGWRVTAAGCTFVREGVPYDCLVEG